MNYIYQSQKVELYIDVYKGQSAVKEDFSRADLRVFLVRDLVRPLHEPIFNVEITDTGTLKCEAYNLPVGVYSLKLIWGKNNKRSPMRVETGVLFSVTDIAEEATNSVADVAKVRVEAHTATYGYDGLSAYELSVWHGKTTLSEDAWLDWMNGRQIERRIIFTNAQPWEVTLNLESETIFAAGGVIDYTATAERSVVNVYNDGTTENTTESSDVEITCNVASVVINTVNHTITIPSYLDATTVRSIVLTARCGTQSVQKQITQTVQPTVVLGASVDSDGAHIDDSNGVVIVSYKNFTIPISTIGEVGTLSVETTDSEEDYIKAEIEGNNVVVSVIGANDTGDDITFTLTVTDGSVSATKSVFVCCYEAEYDNPVVNLSYSPQTVAVGGGSSTPTLAYSQAWRMRYSNGAAEEMGAKTSGGTVVYSDTANLVDASTGVATIGANSSVQTVANVTTVTATVTLNGKTGTATSIIKQAAYVPPAEPVMYSGVIPLTETQALNLANDEITQASLLTSENLATLTEYTSIPNNITPELNNSDYGMWVVLLKDSTKKPQWGDVLGNYADIEDFNELGSPVNGTAAANKSGWYAFTGAASDSAFNQNYLFKVINK